MKINKFILSIPLIYFIFIPIVLGNISGALTGEDYKRLSIYIGGAILTISLLILIITLSTSKKKRRW